MLPTQHINLGIARCIVPEVHLSQSRYKWGSGNTAGNGGRKGRGGGGGKRWKDNRYRFLSFLLLSIYFFFFLHDEEVMECVKKIPHGNQVGLQER